MENTVSLKGNEGLLEAVHFYVQDVRKFCSIHDFFIFYILANSLFFVAPSVGLFFSFF